MQALVLALLSICCLATYVVEGKLKGCSWDEEQIGRQVGTRLGFDSGFGWSGVLSPRQASNFPCAKWE